LGLIRQHSDPVPVGNAPPPGADRNGIHFPENRPKSPGMKTPCIDVCKWDRATGWCRGCGRTKDETKGWKKLAKKVRREIGDALPDRLKLLKKMS
jgi:predicted Fe-S protein YdhL (DUF1289 family)